MGRPKGTASALLSILILAGWFVALRPTALGGDATYIVVSGISMEPTYYDGDLVILHRKSNYDAGDIVAYKTPSGQRTFIHRIVGQDAEGFITQGDNREEIDPWRPTAEEMLGSEWIRIPNAGSLISTLQEPRILGSLASSVLIVGALGGAEHHRRRRKRMKLKWQTSQKPAPSSSPGPDWSGFVAGASTTGVIALACLVLAGLAFRTEREKLVEREVPSYRQDGTFSYSIVMESSTLYPDGVLRSPASITVDSVATDAPAPSDEGQIESLPPVVRPAFTGLAREAQITFSYALEQTSAIVSGTIGFDLVIRADGGLWSRTTQLAAPRPFDGPSVSETVVVDLGEVAETVSQIETETAYAAADYTLEVIPRVTVEGTRGGEPFSTEFEPSFVLSYGRTLITPPAVLTTSEQQADTVMIMAPQSLSFPGGSISVAAARTIGVGGFVLAMIGLASIGGYMAWRLWNDENARIRARYGSRLMQVQTPATDRRQQARKALGVASMRDLARLAERYGTFILHEPLPNGHRYFIRDNDDTYEYVTHSSSRHRGSGQGATTAPEG